MSWQSLSRGTTNVTHRNVLHRICSGEPEVVSGSFSTDEMCMCRIWNHYKNQFQHVEISFLVFVSRTFILLFKILTLVSFVQLFIAFGFWRSLYFKQYSIPVQFYINGKGKVSERRINHRQMNDVIYLSPPTLISRESPVKFSLFC